MKSDCPETEGTEVTYDILRLLITTFLDPLCLGPPHVAAHGDQQLSDARHVLRGAHAGDGHVARPSHLTAGGLDKIW